MTTTTLEDISKRLAEINGTITGVSRSVEHPPVQVATADLPFMYTRFAGSAGDMQMGPTSITYWDFELVVVGKPLAQGLDPSEHVDALLPFPERVRDKYASRLHLNNDAGTALLSGSVSVAGLGNVQNMPVQIGDTFYPSIRVTLRVKDLTQVTVSG